MNNSPRQNGSQPLQVIGQPESCWQQIGIWGDRSCPQLNSVTHCHNCPVFAAAGRRFLDAPPPANYSAEWTERLASSEEQESGGSISSLVFRLGDEWFALPVSVLVEITHTRTAHRVPHRGGLLAGIVNIRGELHLCVRLDLLLGIEQPAGPRKGNPRLIVMRRDLDGWVFAADDVDQVHRLAKKDIHSAPPTLSRASSRLTKGVYTQESRGIGILDEERVFQSLRERVR